MSESEQLRDYEIINASGYLNGRTAESQELKEVLQRAGESELKSNYLINLADTDYIDSNSMGLFVRLLYELQSSDKKLILLAPPKSVENVLLLTGLNELMPIASSEEEACRLLGVEVRRLAGRSEDIDYAQLESELEDLIISSGDPSNLQQQTELQKIMGK